MKKIFLGVAAISIVFASCKKDNDISDPPSPNPPASANTITVGSNVYKYTSGTTAFEVKNNTLIVTALKGDDGAGIVLTFPANAAPGAGSYRVIAEDSVASITTGQVAFVVNEGTDYYNSTGVGAIDLKVSLNNGKYTLVMPAAPVIPVGINGSRTTAALDVTQN